MIHCLAVHFCLFYSLCFFLRLFHISFIFIIICHYHITTQPPTHTHSLIEFHVINGFICLKIWICTMYIAVEAMETATAIPSYVLYFQLNKCNISVIFFLVRCCCYFCYCRYCRYFNTQFSMF